jgi:hypothetical protein
MGWARLAGQHATAHHNASSRTRADETKIDTSTRALQLPTARRVPLAYRLYRPVNGRFSTVPPASI